MANPDLTKEHYEQALQQIRQHFRTVTNAVQPKAILQNGSIGTVGVSDIDLIFVFSDSFDEAERFGEEYQSAVQEVEFREKLFIHQPMVISSNSLKDLPKFTHNPASQLQLVDGEEPDYSATEASPLQSLLISLEFIQFRLYQLLNQLLSGKLNQHGILLRGHSLTHSLDLADRAGIELGEESFPAFDIVESIRESIHEGKQVELSNEEIQQLHRGVIDDFYRLYQLFCQKAATFVTLYLPPGDSYQYDKRVVLHDLFSWEPRLNRSVSKGSIRVTGFHWINMLLRDLYFQENRDGLLMVNPDFLEACRNRARFHRQLWAWNKKVFGTIHAGLSPMPCVIEGEAQDLAQNQWGIS